MVNEQLILDAIEDVKAEPSELNVIAAEYGIKADVLRVRFERSYGPVETFAERQKAAQEQAATAQSKMEMANYIAARKEEEIARDVIAFMQTNGMSEFVGKFKVLLAA